MPQGKCSRPRSQTPVRTISRQRLDVFTGAGNAILWSFSPVHLPLGSHSGSCKSCPREDASKTKPERHMFESFVFDLKQVVVLYRPYDLYWYSWAVCENPGRDQFEIVFHIVNTVCHTRVGWLCKGTYWYEWSTLNLSLSRAHRLCAIS